MDSAIGMGPQSFVSNIRRPVPEPWPIIGREYETRRGERLNGTDAFAVEMHSVAGGELFEVALSHLINLADFRADVRQLVESGGQLEPHAKHLKWDVTDIVPSKEGRQDPKDDGLPIRTLALRDHEFLQCLVVYQADAEPLL